MVLSSLKFGYIILCGETVPDMGESIVIGMSLNLTVEEQIFALKAKLHSKI